LAAERRPPRENYMPVTSREWWLGVAVPTLVILLHAAIPRYEYRSAGGSPFLWMRIDRWTGQAQMGQALPDGSAWRPR